MKRRDDGVIVGGPIGFHECPACRTIHYLPGTDPVRTALEMTAQSFHRLNHFFGADTFRDCTNERCVANRDALAMPKLGVR